MRLKPASFDSATVVSYFLLPLDMEKIRCLCSQCSPNGQEISPRIFDKHLEKDCKRLSDVQARIDNGTGTDMDTSYATFLRSCIESNEKSLDQVRVSSYLGDTNGTKMWNTV